MPILKTLGSIAILAATAGCMATCFAIVTIGLVR